MKSLTNPHTFVWAIIIPAEILMYGGYGILVHLSKVHGQLPYLPSSFVLCTEILKLLVCVIFLWFEKKSGTLKEIPLSSSLPFAIPALCYCLNNNLAVLLQYYMDPATYMVLGNMKIVTTAFLYKIIMKRNFKAAKWLAVGLLALGASLNSLTALQATSLSLTEIHTSLTGLFLMGCYCCISGFSGVFTEYILKKNLDLSVYYQNALLYMFGVLFNSVVWVVQASSVKNYYYLYIFKGYSVYTWILVITQALTGLLMSLIMKHLNNLVRLFIISSAPLVTTILAHLIFDLVVPAEFVLSVLSVTAASFLYSYN